MEEKQTSEKSNSENLLKVISDLQKQKALLQNRLMETNAQKLRETMNKPIAAYHAHTRPLLLLKGVGLLMVIIKYRPQQR
jgi:hypothetical protein